MDKENYPQVEVERCKYKLKRRKMVDFTAAEVDLNLNDSDNSDD